MDSLLDGTHAQRKAKRPPESRSRSTLFVYLYLTSFSCVKMRKNGHARAYLWRQINNAAKIAHSFLENQTQKVLIEPPSDVSMSKCRLYGLCASTRLIHIRASASPSTHPNTRRTCGVPSPRASG